MCEKGRSLKRLTSSVLNFQNPSVLLSKAKFISSRPAAHIPFTSYIHLSQTFSTHHTHQLSSSLLYCTQNLFSGRLTSSLPNLQQTLYPKKMPSSLQNHQHFSHSKASLTHTYKIFHISAHKQLTLPVSQVQPRTRVCESCSANTHITSSIPHLVQSTHDPWDCPAQPSSQDPSPQSWQALQCPGDRPEVHVHVRKLCGSARARQEIVRKDLSELQHRCGLGCIAIFGKSTWEALAHQKKAWSRRL